MRPPGDMHDFALRYRAAGRDLVVEGDCLLAGQAGPVPVVREELGALSAASRRLFAAGGHDTAAAVALGRRIHDATLPGAVGKLLRTALAAAQSTGGLRIQLRLAPWAELHDLAWELWHDGDNFLAMRTWIAVVRFQEMASPVASPSVRPPLRVLFTTAQPEDCPRLDLETEERQVRLALDPLQDWLQLTVERRLSRERLRHLLLRAEDQKKPFHVWHHGGHGGLAADGSFALLLEDQGRRQPVAGADLETAVARCPELRVAVLNVCHGAAPAGLAPALARLNVPVVIGFRTSVLDQAALQFAGAFYGALRRSPAEKAVGEARLALAHQGLRPLDWALPLLFSRSPAAACLLDPEHVAAPPAGAPPRQRAEATLHTQPPDATADDRRLRELMAALRRGRT